MTFSMPISNTQRSVFYMSSITEKAKNQKQVLTLNELSKRKVVEHNSLITSIAKMDKTPLKMFELAVSCINTEEPPKDNTVYLSKADLFAFFKVSDNDKHSRFKQAVRAMQKEAYFEIKEEAGKGFKFKSIVPIPYVEWTDYHDEVKIEFHREIMPYLINLKKNFTQHALSEISELNSKYSIILYRWLSMNEVKIEFHREIMPYLINLKKNFTQHALSEISELNSKYSIILYRWLSMNYNQYEHYSVKGGRRAEQVESYRNPSISVKELRIMTDTVNEYQRFTNFTKKILDIPLKEINDNTTFKVSYEKVKKGQKRTEH